MWLRLYDMARNPAHWLEIVRPGDYCVFILDAKLRIAKDFHGLEFSGDDASVEIVPSLPEAVHFADNIVTHHPELCCEIYTHEGKSGEPVRTVYNPSVLGRYEGMPWAKRETAIGATVISIGLCFITYDAFHGLRWMWGYIIGAKLFVIGGTYLIRGIAGICQHRYDLESRLNKREKLTLSI